jgi:hypothetical protein
MRDKDIGDIIGGLLLVALGIFAVIYSQNYNMGRLQMMGPGFFPRALGYILIVLGIIIALPAFLRKGPAVKVNYKGAFWVILGLLTFAFTLDHLGLILTTVLAVVIASCASTLGWLSKLYLGASVAAITYAIFILGLSMNMPVWPTLLTL